MVTTNDITISGYIDYELRALCFAHKYGVKLFKVGESEYRKYFEDDDRPRYVFKMRLERGGKSYTFHFGQSIVNGNVKPTMYDVLSCLQKYDCGTFEEFCREFGYDPYESSAKRIYKACVKEYNAVVRLFGNDGECYEELCNIA